jgi:quercetin dioxygenase-like cupin family protein
MKNKIILFAGAMIAIALMVVMLSGMVPTQQPAIKRTELQRHDLSVPGREVVQVRVDFEAGEAFGKHQHPGEEIIYVVEGLLKYEVEGKPTVTLKAGDVLFIPAGTIHAAKNVGNGNGAEIATYIVEKGKPLVVLAK